METVTSPNTVTDLLTIVAPPMRLVAWLELVFENKRKKGEDIPENFTRWLERWQRIRSDLPSEIDGTSEQDWLDMERKIFAKVLQP
jgi:hypothetical protein